MAEIDRGPAIGDISRLESAQKRQLNAGVNDEGDEDREHQGERHGDIGTARFPGEVNGVTETDESENDTAARNRRQDALEAEGRKSARHAEIGRLEPAADQGHEHDQRYRDLGPGDRGVDVGESFTPTALMKLKINRNPAETTTPQVESTLVAPVAT